MAAFSLTLLLLANAFVTSFCQLQIHFYRYSCPRTELIAKQLLRQHLQQDPSISASLIRLYFHDCYIRGCDGSVLIDSTINNTAEKDAIPNLTLRGFEVIDDIKAALEKECSRIVSCADILALAARDAVSFSGGAAYSLPLGRRDGTVSRKDEVSMPSPWSSLQTVLDLFRRSNLNLVDLTTLLGAHNMGFCHCGVIVDRLYDYHNTGTADPSMDVALLEALKQQCPPEIVDLNNLNKDRKVYLNQAVNGTLYHFALNSTTFFANVLTGRVVLRLDQDLAFNNDTSWLASKYVRSPKSFIRQFSKSMIKLGSLGVLTGQQGEIRISCRKVNNDTSVTSAKRWN